MNRREFNRLGAISALGLTASMTHAETFDYPWKLGVITDEVDFDLSRVLSGFVPKYQLHWIEIRNLKLDGKNKYAYKDASPAQLKQIRSQIDGAGVKLSLLDTAVYKITLPGTQPLGASAQDLHPAQGEFDTQMDDLKRGAEAAHTLGTDRLRIFTFRRVADPNSVFNQVVDNLHKALAVAKASDVKLVIENEFSCNTATGAESAQLFKAIPDGRLSLNWDPGNCIEAGEQPFPQGWDKLDTSRISHVHLKDAQGKKWAPIGSGEIDFVGQFQALKKIKYSGTMSLETHYRNAQNDLYSSSVESMDGLVGILKKV